MCIRDRQCAAHPLALQSAHVPVTHTIERSNRAVAQCPTRSTAEASVWVRRPIPGRTTRRTRPTRIKLRDLQPVTIVASRRTLSKRACRARYGDRWQACVCVAFIARGPRRAQPGTGAACRAHRRHSGQCAQVAQGVELGSRTRDGLGHANTRYGKYLKCLGSGSGSSWIYAISSAV